MDTQQTLFESKIASENKSKGIILAIDPGNEQSAYVIWDGHNEVIREKGILPNRELLDYMPATNRLAIEMVASYGMPVGKEVFETVLWIGRFIQKFCGDTDNYDKIYRKEVKVYFCNSVKAKDGNIRQALIDRFGQPGVKKNPGKLYKVHDDEWSALAIGVYSYDHISTK